MYKRQLDNCADDVKFLNDMFDKGLIERLQGVLKDDFVRLPYTEAVSYTHLDVYKRQYTGCPAGRRNLV